MDVCDKRGRPIHDDTFLVLLNAYWEMVPFVLPGELDLSWKLILDTDNEDGFIVPRIFSSAQCVDVKARSLCLLELIAPAKSKPRPFQDGKQEASTPT